MESSAEHDQRVMIILADALRLPAAERESFLKTACGEDADLHREVKEAIEWEDRMGTFLLQPLIHLASLARPFQPGQIISERFEIVREIGEGGMGVVYEAFDRKRNQRIAIKSAKPGFHRLLSPELEGALKVRHPNICLVNEIHTADTEDGPVDFLTMEFLEGETLFAYLLRKRKLGHDEALDIARQLCAGIAEAHRSGILHRDLKSANVILCHNEDGSSRAVITDFGLSGGLIQPSGQTGGTPGYMAPELLRGEKASKKSDIYALGVMLYEIVAGRKPVPVVPRSEEDAARLPPPPSTIVPGLDRRWDPVILRCLEPVPDARTPEASLVLRGLRRQPIRKAPVVAAALLLLFLTTAFAFIPSLHNWAAERIHPPGIRLAILPLESPPDAAALGEGVLQDVSDRIGRLQGGRRTVAVMSPSETGNNNVQTPEQAKRLLQATHALKMEIHREGDELVTEGSIIDLATQIPVRQFTGRYSSVTAGTIPAAVAGEVSVALALNHATASDVLSSTATGPYDRGLFLLRRDDQSFVEAASLFQEAARLDPRSPLPLAGLVEAQILNFQTSKSRKALDEAQRYLLAAESLSPDSVSVRLAAGNLNETNSQYEKALDDYRRVLDLEPRNISALLRMARVYDALDNPDQAVAMYRKAIDLDPGYYEPYHALGIFYYYRGMYPQAAEQFQKSIARAPGRVGEYTNLGAVLSDLGRDAEAEQALTTSLNLRETANALNSMGAMRAYQKRDAEAVSYYLRAVADDPHTYQYWLNLGDSYRRLGHSRDATLAYEKGMDLALAELGENPRRGYTRAFVAYFAVRLGDRQRAEEEISQATKLTPGDNKVIRRAVLTYEALGQRDRAIEALTGATSQLLQELDRQPDLADFRQDLRFTQLVAKISKEGQ